MPIFFPPAMLYMVEKRNMMPRNFYLRTLLELTFIATELYFAVPFAIGVYPQTSKIKAEKLEPEFQNLIDKNG